MWLVTYVVDRPDQKCFAPVFTYSMGDDCFKNCNSQDFVSKHRRYTWLLPSYSNMSTLCIINVVTTDISTSCMSYWSFSSSVPWVYIWLLDERCRAGLYPSSGDWWKASGGEVSGLWTNETEVSQWFKDIVSADDRITAIINTLELENVIKIRTVPNVLMHSGEGREGLKQMVECY